MSAEYKIADVVTKEVLKKAMTMVDVDKLAKAVATQLEKELTTQLVSSIKGSEYYELVYDKMLEPLTEAISKDILKKLGVKK
jgi:2-phosphoglycerate kinase